jgi:hypothetical protein
MFSCLHLALSSLPLRSTQGIFRALENVVLWKIKIYRDRAIAPVTCFVVYSAHIVG